MGTVNFRQGTLSDYKISTKEEDTLYFISDERKIYKGSKDITSNLEVVTGFDTDSAGAIKLANADVNKFYVNLTTFEMRIKNGSAWSVMSPGYLVSGGSYAPATDDKRIGTIGFIKSHLVDFLSTVKETVTFNATNGTVTVNGSDPVTLTGVIHDITYAADTLTLTIPQYGKSDIVINLPRDNFVSSGRYDSATQEIVLTLKDNSAVKIPAADLVDTYTGEQTNSTTVSVSSDNKITAVARISAANGNIISVNNDGLFAKHQDISGKVDKISNFTTNELLMAGSATGAKTSGYTLLVDGTLDDATNKQIPVATVIAATIQAAQGTLENEIKSKLDTKLDSQIGQKPQGSSNSVDSGKILVVGNDGVITMSTSTLNDLVSGNVEGKADKLTITSADANIVLVSDANGNFALSNNKYKIGGNTLAQSGNYLATETAVKTALNDLLVWNEIPSNP